MNIIICGAGRVGFTIAKILGEQGHSITVIDQSSEDIQKIDDTLDVKAIVGKATYPSILEKANASEADMIIAVTRNDEINMLICQIAFSIFNVQKKIARIRSQDYLNPKFTKVYNKENLPIDVIISPEIEIAKSLQRKLEAPGALDNVPFAKNKIRLLEVLINENCPLIDIKLKDLTKKFPKLDANIMGVIRNEKFAVLKKEDVIKKDDKAYIAINASQMQDTLSAFGHNEKISNKFLIIGGGNIGFNLAKNLEETFDSARVKIIEKNKERAEFIASELNNTIIINGVEELKKLQHEVVADRIEAGSFAIAASITMGDIEIKNIIPKNLKKFLKTLEYTGSKVEISKNAIKICASKRPLPHNIITEEYPGFPTDLQAQYMTLMTIADGKCKISENIFENRFMHVPELIRMGARISVNKQIATVTGVNYLKAAKVMASDLRASMCLILGGLVARGTSEVDGIYHLDRGYENLENKLSDLGANIRRSI